MKILFLRIAMLFILSILFVQCSKSGTNNTNAVAIPELKANIAIDVTQTTVNSQVIFTGSSSDLDNNIVSWIWDFADGSPNETNKIVKHQFLLGGNYSVKLSIRNNSGKTTSISKSILVKNTATPNYGSLTGLKAKLALLQPKIMVAAHRAYQKNYPENSKEAIIDAAANDINIVEIDARFTMDKELILMHDATTNRTTNGNFPVAQRTLAELKALKLLFKGIPSVYNIPTLTESLEAAKGKVYVNIDASWDNSLTYYNKIYNTVAALNMLNMVMIYTESAEVAKGLLELDNEVIVLLGAGSVVDYNNATIMNPKAAIWHMASATLSPNFTNWPNNNGIKLWANAYVNSTDAPPASGNDAAVNNLISNQISLIQTDYPIEIINYLKAQNVWLK